MPRAPPRCVCRARGSGPCPCPNQRARAPPASASTHRAADGRTQQFDPQDLEAFREIAQDPNPFKLLTNSICPAIYGHETVCPPPRRGRARLDRVFVTQRYGPSPGVGPRSGTTPETSRAAGTMGGHRGPPRGGGGLAQGLGI